MSVIMLPYLVTGTSRFVLKHLSCSSCSSVSFYKLVLFLYLQLSSWAWNCKTQWSAWKHWCKHWWPSDWYRISINYNFSWVSLFCFIFYFFKKVGYSKKFEHWKFESKAVVLFYRLGYRSVSHRYWRGNSSYAQCS